MRNADIARMLERLADLLEIDGANPFRVRAYRNAAQTIRAQSRSMVDMVTAGEDLSELPGIGDDIAAKIGTIVTTGRLPLLEQVAARVPEELSDVMNIEGLGAKRVKFLFEELGIRGIEDLRRAARTGKIRELSGFGKKSEESILKRVEALSGREERMLIAEAEEIAEPLLEYLAGRERSQAARGRRQLPQAQGNGR